MDTPSKIGEERNTVESNCCYMECLPGDVIFGILVRVPAQDVHYSARLVCRKFHKIINTRDFKQAHLHQTTSGLLVVDPDILSRHQQQQMTFIATGSKSDDDPIIEISKLSYRPQHNVLSSCNGLLLEARGYIPRIFYITNPATERKLDLPPFVSKIRDAYGCCMAYAATTMEYKVVTAFTPHGYEPQDICVSILTLGVDKDWTRRVNTQHLSLHAKELLEKLNPLTTQGFVHWARDAYLSNSYGYERCYGCVLTLNVATEIITQFWVPSLRRSGASVWTQLIYLPKGSYLSLFVPYGFLWELWEMKPETGEWTEMPSIDLEAQFAGSRSHILKPVGWLRPREVLVFSVTEICSEKNNSPPFRFEYTVRTRKLQKFTLDGGVNRYLVHRNSLEWINGF